jgi:hypothetical protein
VTDANQVDPERVGSQESESTGPRVTDKRRLDPETGKVRQATSGSGRILKPWWETTWQALSRAKTSTRTPPWRLT